MVPTGLANSDDCPVFNERERPKSREQLSPFCSFVRNREIALANHCQSPFLVVGGEVAPHPVAIRVLQAPMYHRPMPQIATPILKKRYLDHNHLNNYRLVSNLCFIAKILEKLVLSQESSYLNSHNLYNTCQSAYRPGHSTETALRKLLMI